MSAAQYTPGPWRVAPASLYVGSDINVDAGTNGYIALCGKRGDPTAEANARLIASVPDLLAALKRATDAAQQDWDSGTEPPEWFAGACAAIAKAVHQ